LHEQLAQFSSTFSERVVICQEILKENIRNENNRTFLVFSYHTSGAVLMDPPSFCSWLVCGL